MMSEIQKARNWALANKHWLIACAVCFVVGLIAGLVG